MIVACVLRTGGSYGPVHVGLLQEQLGPEHPLTVFTDDLGLSTTWYKTKPLPKREHPCGLPLAYYGWWAKMELFAPEIRDDIVYFDLDTVIVTPPSILTDPVTEPMILRDVYRADGLQSSVMVLPRAFRSFIWKQWASDPHHWMDKFRVGGDQAFLEYCGKQFWTRLQDRYPGEYRSWKADALAGRPLHHQTRVIVFHGHPKPWDIPDDLAVWRHQDR